MDKSENPSFFLKPGKVHSHLFAHLLVRGFTVEDAGQLLLRGMYAFLPSAQTPGSHVDLAETVEDLTANPKTGIHCERHLFACAVGATSVNEPQVPSLHQIVQFDGGVGGDVRIDAP